MYSIGEHVPGARLLGFRLCLAPDLQHLFAVEDLEHVTPHLPKSFAPAGAGRGGGGGGFIRIQ